MKKRFVLLALCLTTVFAALAEDEIYAVWNQSTTTLTLRYDDRREANNGVTEWWMDATMRTATKVIFDESMKAARPKSTRSWFDNFEKLTQIQHLDYLNTSEAKSMEYMFYHCEALTSLDLSKFNTENVTDMSNMFCGCYSLTSLNVSRFNTGKVTTMGSMFAHCSSLTSLNLSSFNTAKVTDMSAMFYLSKSLTSVNLCNFNTSEVTNMEMMFCSCYSLTFLDISMFNTAKVTDMSAMFASCTNLTTIYCNEDWSNRTNLDSENMFIYCEVLKGGNGTVYDENHIDASYARPDRGASKPGYFTKRPKEIYTVFVESTGTLTYYCNTQKDSRTEGTVETYDPVNEPNKVRFIGYNTKVTKAVIDPSMKDTLLTSMRSMFYGGLVSSTPYSLTNLSEIEGLENLHTENVTDMRSMFRNCNSLTALDLTSFNTAKVTNMG